MKRTKKGLYRRPITRQDSFHRKYVGKRTFKRGNVTRLSRYGTRRYSVLWRKLDGIRCDLQIDSCYARLFSRRISKKTNWYSENTHNFPVITNHALPKELMVQY